MAPVITVQLLSHQLNTSRGRNGTANREIQKMEETGFVETSVATVKYGVTPEARIMFIFVLTSSRSRLRWNFRDILLQKLCSTIPIKYMYVFLGRRWWGFVILKLYVQYI
jgi:hypothetical protein